MPQLLSSKTIVEEEAPKVRSVPNLATAVAGFVFVTQRGPVGTEQLVNSVEEFEAIFGGHITNSDARAIIQAFFDNGGTEAHVVRTVHYTDVATPATKASTLATLTLSTPALAATAGAVVGTVVGPYNLEPNDTLVAKVDGGGDLTATFTATAAARESAAENFALVNAQTLTVAVDGGGVQTISFLTAEFVSIGAATAEEVAAVINAKIVGAKATVTSGGTKVTITSDRRGTGSNINVTGGTANGALAFTTGALAGTGNVSNIDAVTVAEVKVVFEAAVAGTTVTDVGGAVTITRNVTGAAASVQVVASSTADDELGLDNAVHAGVDTATLSTLRVDAKTDGTYANSLRAKVKAATSGEAARFDMEVLDSASIILEVWPNLTMDDADPRYVETIVNATLANGGSRYIAAVDLDAATTAALQRPNSGTFGPLTGGGDGLSSIADVDFTGDAAGQTGIRALDTVQGLTMLAVPDQPTSAVHNAMLTYCEVTRGGQPHAFLGPPSNNSASQIVTYVKTTAALKNLSEHGSFFWPRVKIANPSKAIFGTVDRITVSPIGHIMGAYSRTDNARVGGIYDACANQDLGRLFGVLELEHKDALLEAKRDLVFPERINPLRKDDGSPFYIDGARTLKENGSWPWTNQRRGVSFIGRTLKLIEDIFRHKNRNPNLPAMKRAADIFLLEQFRRKAFATDTNPALAFFTDVGLALNPASQANVGTIRCGVAMTTPMEFIIIKIGQDTRLIEAELAAAAG